MIFRIEKILFIFFIVCLTMIVSCAKIGSPTGGKKDIDPPRVIEFKPERGALMFKEKLIEIEFDEYVQLKGLNQQMIVSPPMKNKPISLLKGKKLEIEFQDTLKENTTYYIDFGEGIADINEGNLLKDFFYTFSTGSYFDTLAITGKVLNAFDLTVEKEPIMVVLYKSKNDSVVFNSFPDYAGRTKSDGTFYIPGISPGNYQVFALKDGNGNIAYEKGVEKVGFLDSITTLSSLVMSVDTAMRDSIKVAQSALKLDFLVFSEQDEKQYIKKYERKIPQQLFIQFNNPVDSFSYQGVFVSTEGKVFKEVNVRRDSMMLWLTDTSLIKTDTLRLILNYFAREIGIRSDTLLFRTSEEKDLRKKTSKKEEKNKIKISVSGSQDTFLPLALASDYPIRKIDASRIKLELLEDTIYKSVLFQLLQDSTSARKYHLFAKWMPGSSYKITMLTGAFEDYFSFGHDTINSQFTTRNDDYYGKLVLKFKKSEGTKIIQLLDQGKVAHSKILKGESQLTFDFLHPKSYTLKVISDLNSNGEWDTGDVIQKKQPEAVFIYPKPLVVKSNWDIEEEVDLK